ncbi:MAG: SEC-C metal-binding domain-containing protein, partial [bacterium]|nr:SEC-C metal-binding domain-containing protein [bacterium]
GTLQGYIAEILTKAGKDMEEYAKKEQQFGAEHVRQAERIVALRVLDSLWVEHLENMEALRDSVKLRAYGQQDPLIEYKNEGRKRFQSFIENMESTIANGMLSLSEAHHHHRAPQQVPMQDSQYKDVGRNDPCPCGSGLKYKRCGLIRAPEHRLK